MDLTKARKRAKELAEKKKLKEKAGAEPGTEEKSSAPVDAPAAKPGKKAESAKPRKAKRKKTKTQKASEKPDRKPEKQVSDKQEEKETIWPVEVREITEEDVFTDDAFGEDLPPLGLAEEEKECDVLLGGPEPPPEPEPSPAVPEPEKTDEFSFDFGGQVSSRTPEKPLDEKPGAGEPFLPSEDSTRKQLFLEPEPGEQTRERQISEARAEAREQEPVLDWDEEEWTIKAPGEEDDFFSLVSEELYMREFGMEPEKDYGHMLELLSFRLAKEKYGVPLTSIRQIIKLMPITMVPRAPEFVLGVISLRGNIIPVFDLRRRLKLPAAPPTRKSRIVVVSDDKYTLGLIVDEVEQVARIPESSLEPPPPMLAGVDIGFIKGIGRFQNQMILVLDLEKIMVPVGTAAEKR